MKKHFKKLLVALLAIVGVVCLAAGLAACDNGDGDNNPNTPSLVPLIAPTLTLTDDVLSWNAVPHATGYVVYENGESVSEQVATTYTITQDYPGTYAYTVMAVTTEVGYKDSPVSAAKTFKVDPWPLAAPVISIDQDTGVISWEAVDNADGYDVYQEGVRIASVYELNYTIEETNPAIYNFTVKATSTNKAYSTSEHSEPASYKVPLHLTIGIEFPNNFSGEVTVSLYDAESGELVDETTVVREEEYEFGSAKMVVEWGSYVAKITDLADNYVATWANVSTQKRSASITIVEKTTDNVLSLDKNTITLTLPAGETSVTAQYIFIAGHSNDGAHSISVDRSLSGLQITASGKSVINTAQSTYNGSFVTKDGEVIVISVTYTKPEATAPEEGEDVVGEEEAPADQQFTFELEIMDYEVRQYLSILPERFNIERYETAHYDNYVNVIYDSCGRYIEVQESGTYEFIFLNSTTGDRTITLTVNGKEYSPGYGGGTTQIELQAGTEIRIQIDVEGTGFGGAEFVSFWVYKA